MPFGAWKGKEIGEIPEEYLLWLWVQPDLYGRCEVQIRAALICHDYDPDWLDEQRVKHRRKDLLT